MRFLKALVLALALVLAAAVPVSARPAPAATFTLDSTLSSAPAVAKMWSSGTGVLMQVGSCSGPGCIEVVVTDWPCGAGYAGCAYGQSDGSCKVEMSTRSVSGSDALEFNVLGHEGGHCVVGTGYHNTAQERSIMYPTLSVYENKKSLTRDDKVFAQQRF